MNAYDDNPSKRYLILPVIVTLLYWFWESQAEGNIRVDLLLIYPLLFLVVVVQTQSDSRPF